ncbi:TPA: baseplate J/gp47 family protein [Yersinia enterocolitica]|nr:baseplate J/gp47 family protein [Yersinia enterocolitica]HEN3266837.1 baseplate J/gp47 family protein [Yersinia enterocolitica]
MAYKPPALSTLLARGQADIESRLPGTFAQPRFSTAGAIAFANAGNTAGLHDHLAWTSRQIIPHLADEDKLLEHCEFWGVWRKPAATAAGFLTVTLVSNSVIPQGTRWQRPDGVLFESVAEVRAGAGTVAVAVVALDAGKNGNTAANVVLELVSAVAFVQSKALVSQTTISGGAELESIDSLGVRLLFRVQYPPSGGNQFDYVRWALECAGVTRAWCIPRYRGYGTVGVMFVLDEEVNIFPTPQDIARVKDYLTAHINPVTNQVEGKTIGAELIVESPKPLPLNPVIRIVPNTEEVRAAVIDSLNNYIATLPRGGTALLSQLRATISNAPGETDNTVISPVADQYAAENELFVLGNIAWR